MAGDGNDAGVADGDLYPVGSRPDPYWDDAAREGLNRAEPHTATSDVYAGRNGSDGTVQADSNPEPRTGSANSNDNDDPLAPAADRALDAGGYRQPDPPNNPLHTGLHDPPPNHGIVGDRLPDMSRINTEFRLANGSVDPDRFNEWTRAVTGAYPRIEEDGVAGVYDYTTENYEGMNPYLRGVDPLSPEQQFTLGAEAIDQMTDAQRSSWEERISNTDDGLAALPPYRADPADATSTTWRGMHASDELLAQLEFGDLFEDPAYLSTSTDPQIAEDFALSSDPSKTPTMLSIEGYDGVDVSQISRYTDEAEILFPRGSRFQVVSRVVGEGGLIHIVLRQVQS